jgi:hypothetical protein
MKTTIVVYSNGTFKLATYARGKGAQFWVAFLNGKAQFSIVK